MFEKIDREIRQSGWPPLTHGDHNSHTSGKHPCNRLTSVTHSVDEGTNEFGFRFQNNNKLWSKCVTISQEDVTQPDSAFAVFQPEPEGNNVVLSTFNRGVKLTELHDEHIEDETSDL